MRFDAPCCWAVNPPSDIVSFIARWAGSGAAERANYQLFLSELCDVIGVPRPDPTRPDDADNAYVFERSVTFHHPDGATSTGRIDLYKRGCYVLEAKQGVEKQAAAEALAESTKAKARAAKKGTARRGSAAWDEAMLKARSQAEQYARALPASEGRPPLLIVVDVGHSIELYSEFSRTGGTYIPFPDPRNHRIFLSQLEDPAVRETLRLAWADPLALDPSSRSARVTREIAQSLGRLAASLEKSGHSAESVAAFLMRSLFTMFAEDVELLPKDSFSTLLKTLRGNTGHFAPMIEELWSRMKTGGFSTALRENVRHFNGGLFENATALPLSDDQFELLIEASRADWRDVEPSIFGTLLVRALDPTERHKLGAHYTPRAYVERLVLPTIIEPLRAEWNAVRAAALTLDRQGKTAEAIKEVQGFHRRLCSIRILDPACGTGNFLYVTLEHLKRLEGEVIDVLTGLGHEQSVLEMSGFTVDPHQFLGIEVNPRAAAIAEIVLWIGYLQWHFRTSGRVAPPEPIIRAFHNIECRDAVLTCDATEPVLDELGAPVTRWDGRTMKKHPVTGEDVPDESSRVPLLSYVNPHPAEWPQADYIVGNPPFIGNKRMRFMLGEGYVDALRAAHPTVPGSADFVMFWWEKAASIVRGGSAQQFGFITTNSITQTQSGQVVQQNLEAEKPVSLVFAVPDHPWVDSADGAAVRIAMTVARAGKAPGKLLAIVSEADGEDDAASVVFREQLGDIHANFDIGNDVRSVAPLRANERLCWQGCKLVGEHFQIPPEKYAAFVAAQPGCAERLPRYSAGSDITKKRTPRHVIDFFGLTQAEAFNRYPALMQHVVDYVKPEREQNNDLGFRTKWWLFGRPRPDLREACAGLRRYIVTSEVAKHRTFTFLEWPADLIDGGVIAIASDDAYVLGVLSSRIHVVWAVTAGGRMGKGNDPRYQNGPCFDPFPFPTATDALRVHIRNLAEAIDAHRKRQQAQHPKLTLTDCYNVLEKLQAGTPLNAKEQLTHEQGLVTVLRQFHDDLDAAVAEAYGLPPTATDEAILTHLCALNAQRAAEERAGQIRWLRPAFQNPASTATQTTLATPPAASVPKSTTPVPQSKTPWPKTLAEQAQSVRAALADFASPASAATLASSFKNANSDRIAELLDTLASLGQARALPDGTFIAT